MEASAAVRRSARSAVRRIALDERVEEVGSAMSWPMPSMSSSSLPGIGRRGRAAAGDVHHPVGQAVDDERSASAARAAAACGWAGSGPPASGASRRSAERRGRRCPRPACARALAVRREAGRADQLPDHGAGRRRRPPAGRAAARSASAAASGLCQPTVRRPVVDMMLVSDSTRRGCSIAIVCAIMPPIETPTTCAASMPRWSRRPRPSSARSAMGVRRPTRPADERPDQRRRA